MDITKITDIKELKSLAYDQLAVLEGAQSNIRALNSRIAELTEENQEKAKKGTEGK